ncbi:MAG: hypothetical protein IJX71_03760 [Oscillospiraceae bacterium]|nr:hypothetical protein [Oscillospiraceae bacterium]
MKRVWQEERRLALEDGEELGLDYWFLTDETCWGQSYGLAVTDSRGGEEIIRHITTDREEAELLLKRIAAGTVTPVTASDVVEDFLAR